MSLTAYVPVVWVDYADDPDLTADYLNHLEIGIQAVTDEVLALEAAIPLAYQPISSELTALSSLSGPGYSKRAGAGSWSVVASIPQADISGLSASLAAKEDALGNPSTSGWVLSSTTGGVRSWVPMSGGGGVSTVFGRTGNVTAQSGDYTTAQVTESTNLYFTSARAIAAATPAAIGALAVGATAANSNALGGLDSSFFVQGINAHRSTAIGSGIALSAVDASGFYQASSPPDTANESYQWTHLINCAGYAWDYSSRYAFQIAASFSGGNQLDWGAESYSMRVITGGVVQPWRRLWHSGNFQPSNYLPTTGGTISGSLYVTGSVTANSFARPGGSSSRFLKEDGSVDSTAYATVASVSGVYQPVENQRLSTGDDVLFNKVTTNDLFMGNNSRIIAYGLERLRFTVDGTRMIDPAIFDSISTFYGTPNFLAPLAFSGSARIMIDSGGWEIAAPTTGVVFAVEGQSIGPVNNNLRLPTGATFGIYYRNDSGTRTLLSAGSINMYGRTGLLMGGADGNWHLLHV